MYLLLQAKLCPWECKHKIWRVNAWSHTSFCGSLCASIILNPDLESIMVFPNQSGSRFLSVVTESSGWLQNHQCSSVSLQYTQCCSVHHRILRWRVIKTFWDGFCWEWPACGTVMHVHQERAVTFLSQNAIGTSVTNDFLTMCNSAFMILRWTWIPLSIQP